MSLKYNLHLDLTCIGNITGAHGRVFQPFQGPCYGSVLPIRQELRSNKQAKYYDFYWADKYSEHFKSTKRSNQIIKWIRETGVLRNTTVKRIKLDTIQQSKENRKLPECDYYLRIRFNLDKCKDSEMFLVGCIFRYFTTNPLILDNFYKLCELHRGEIETSLLFQIAPNITWDKEHTPIYPKGHSVIAWGYYKLAGVTFKDFLSLVDSNPSVKVLRQSSTYAHVPLHETFIKNVMQKIPYGGEVPKYNHVVQPYSKEVIYSFLSEENV